MKELEYPIQSIPKGRRFCTMCGEIKRETNFEGDSTHCTACCEKMRHTRVRWYGVLTFVLMLSLAAAAGFLGAHTVRFCAALQRADALADEARLYDACNLYDDTIDSLSSVNRSLLLKAPTDDIAEDLPAFFTAGVNTWRRYASVYARTHSDYDTATTLSYYLDKRQIEADPALSVYLEAKEAYETVYNAMNEITQNAQSAGTDIPYDELIAALDAVVEQNDSHYYQGYASLFRASATRYFRSENTAQALEEYDRALELLPDEYINIYSAQAQIAGSLQDWTLLRKVGEAMLSQNRNYMDAYTWVAYAAAKLGDTDAARDAAERMKADNTDSPLYEKLLIQTALVSGDLDAARRVVDQAKTRLDENGNILFNTLLSKRELDDADKRYLRAYIQYATFEGIVCLLEDDLDAADDAAFEHGYNYGYYLEYLTSSSEMSQLTIDVAWICASLTENEESLGMLTDMAPGYDWAKQIVDGKMTMRQAFLEGGADLL